MDFQTLPTLFQEFALWLFNYLISQGISLSLPAFQALLASS